LEKLLWLSDHGCKVLVEHLQDGIFVIEDEKFTYVNQHLADMFAYPVDGLIGKPFIELVADMDKAMVQERHHARIAGKNVPELYDIHIITGHGSIICCSLNVGLSTDQSGKFVAVGSVRDVTQQRVALASLQAAKADLSSIFEQLPDVFYRTDMQGIITKMSPSCFDVLGYSAEEFLGTSLASYYKTPEERQKVVLAIIAGGGKATRVEAAFKHKNGSTVWVSTSAIVRNSPEGHPICIEGVARDVTEQKGMEEHLIALSRIDSMTGVYNRRYYMDKCEEVINMMKRYHRPASMMVADLDYFKSINDSYGHHAGDLALKAFADVCRQEIRESDFLGRLGGEEFGLMLPETTFEQAKTLAERIRKSVEDLVVRVGDDSISFTVSIGLVELNINDTSLDSIMSCADLAMYRAKATGRNRVVALNEPC